MARLRTLKPEFFTHELLTELSPLHRLLFAGLWCQADREGRLEDRPRYLKTVILPYDSCDVSAMLEDLADKGFIIRYEVERLMLISIPAFLRHQKPHPREKPSELPPPPVGASRRGPRLDTPEGLRAIRVMETQGVPQGMPKDIPEQDLGTAEPRKGHAQPRKGTAEPGCLGDFGLGDFGLGEIRLSPEETKRVLEVYQVYRETFGRRHLEPSPAERDLILSRLREEFQADELKEAVVGLGNSEWHRKKGHTALRYALGDRDTVARCMQWAQAPPDEQEAYQRFDPNQGIIGSYR